MTGTKYGDLVKPLSFRKGRGGANARELVFMSGDELAGFEFNFIVGCTIKPVTGLQGVALTCIPLMNACSSSGMMPVTWVFSDQTWRYLWARNRKNINSVFPRP